jgi:signal transduction histidine kinase
VKRTRKSVTQTPLPAVRAIPPRIPSLLERRAFRIGAAVVGVVVAAGCLVGAALRIVDAIDQGTLPRMTFSLAALAVLMATAAYFAGRNESDQARGATSDRNRTKGRLSLGALGLRASRKEQEAAHSAAGQTETAGGGPIPSASVALKTKFLDDISQELRAPITSICLAARIIRKHFDSTPEVVAHFGDTLLAEADRLGQTVDEFVELARLESGITEWRDAEVDAADLIQQAVADIESIAVSYGVSVGFTLEPELPSLHVDLERVTQALTILLASGVRSATEGSELVIQIAGAHGGWVFTVGAPSFVFPHAEARKIDVRADDGAGVDELPSQATGRGLGLCLCREIVTHYHGRLWVEGNQGAPNCVRFTLPYRQNRRPSTAAPAPSVQKTVAPSLGAAADLEQRRELAVKALLERAAVQSQSDLKLAASPAEASKNAGREPATSGTSSQLRSATATKAGAASPDAPPSPTASPATETTERSGAREPTSSTATSRTEPPTGERVEAKQELETPPAETAMASAPVDRDIAEAQVARSAEAAYPSESFEAAAGEALTVDTETGDEIEGEAAVEAEIEDAPVHAPVSGTMITAHHRTAGPPMLANAGVPIVRGSQSAATAAMQGSDELLLEIAQAQTSDGNQLVVSDHVRTLLESAPGTLPAVAGQTLPAAGGARGAYTPTKRRMVAAPWVVRTPSDAAATEPPPPPEDPQVAAQQRARLNERLAKRLGIQRGGNAPGQNGQGSATPNGGRGGLSRTRRLG